MVAWPVPFRATAIFPTPVGMVSEPLSTPVALGVKLALTVQLAPTARDDEQVVLVVKGADVEGVPILTAIAPVFVSVMFWVAEVLPMFVVAKLSEVPDSPTDCVGRRPGIGT